MKIGLVDADLLDGGTRFPNLALMKIAGYYKRLGNDVELVHCYGEQYDKIFVAKVFTKTQLPGWVNLYRLEGTEIEYGGTGFNLYDAPQLPYEIEHTTPDYTLYERYIEKHSDEKRRKTVFTEYYLDASIGFTTRGCIRKCPFCVNRNKARVERWSPVREFFDPQRKYVIMLDDNVFAYPKWAEIFDELEETERPIRYIQGMDVRLMTPEKAKRLEQIRYYKDIHFAFDNVNDRPVIEKGFSIFRENCPKKRTAAYVLIGFYMQGEDELKSVIERVETLAKYNVDPYITKHENSAKDPFPHILTEIQRWGNQPAFRKTTFGQFLKIGGSKTAMKEFNAIPSRTRERLANLLRPQ